MRICSACGCEKAVTEFYKRDGHCKPCRRVKVKLYREANADHYDRYERARAALPHRVQARATYIKNLPAEIRAANTRKWRARNREKVQAWQKVVKALRDGTLLRRSSCERCERSDRRLHAHHDDHSAALVVRWLCDSCHSHHHLNLRRQAEVRP